MKKTKSLLAFFLAAMLCLGLAACGGDKGAAAYTLNAEDADLDKAPAVIVEPDKAPFNLGGWTYHDIVAFHFTGIEKDGNYSVTLDYSKASSDGDEARILVKDVTNDVAIFGVAKATGEDWATYQKYTMPDNVYVSGGKTDIAIEADYDHEGDHFLNLRSITLTYVGEGTAPAPQEEPPKAASVSLDDFAGWWGTDEYPDSFYFDEDFFWETYDSDGDIFLQGDIIDNGDNSFTLMEVDLGEYGDLVADPKDESLTLYTTDGYTFYFYSIANPLSGGSSYVGDEDDTAAYNPYVGEWSVYDGGQTATVIFWSDLTMSIYGDGTWLGDGTYDPDAGTFYVAEEGVTPDVRDMYYDAEADQVNLLLEGTWYAFDPQ